MMTSMTNNGLMDIPVLLGKEFWGILSFEMNLPSLYKFLQGKKMGIGLKRFTEWVLFPDKIPFEFQKKMVDQLNHRMEHPDYPSFLQREMKDEEKTLDPLIRELLHIKYAGSSIRSHSFPLTLTLSPDAFFAIFFQFVERGYLSANDVFHHWYPYFKNQKEELK